MAEVLVVTATWEHATQLAKVMRPQDVAEVAALRGCEPELALHESLSLSREAWTAFIDGHIACMWGIRDHPQSAPARRIGIPWLLTGAIIERYPITFVRGSRVVVAYFMESYDVLVQEVDGRYCRALSWLGKLGFVLGPTRPLGAEGVEFRQVQKEVA